MANSDKLRNDGLLTPPLRALITVALVVGICFFAREVLLPFALAVLLSFLLAPLATRLQRWGLGHVGGVVVTVVLAFAVLGALILIVGKNTLDVARELPRYEDRLVQRIRELRPSGRNPLTEAAETAERIEKAIVAPDEEDADAEAPVASSRFTLRETLFGRDPLPVRIVDTSFKPFRIFKDLGPYLTPLGSAAIVVVFVIFILLERENLRDRIIRLAGTSRVYVTTQALEDAARRVSKYLLMQLIVNSIYGAAVGMGLYFIGLPNAVLWGLMATILRFLPYVGPIIAAVTPIALSFAVFDGWERPLVTMGLFLIAELITNNILEPWLYGTSTGVSTLAIVVSAVFWTWLWGPVGLVLATPLTVCLTVMARHVPQLAFLNVLLADDPPLELRYRFYQRLLAQDYEEAADVASEFLRNGSLQELYEKVFVPALGLAERDRDAGRLTAGQEAFVYESIAELVEDTHDEFQVSAAGTPSPEDAADEPAPDIEEAPAVQPPRILCIAAEDEADRIAAIMFAHLLTARGYLAEAAETFAASSDTLRAVESRPPDGIAISTIAPGGSLRLRSACRKLRRSAPAAKLIVGLWHARSRLERAQTTLKKAGADAGAATFEEALDFFHEAIPPHVADTRDGGNGAPPTKTPLVEQVP